MVLELGGRRWRVRGLERNTSYERLKVNLLVAAGDLFHVDSLDLYSARQRGLFLKQAAVELEVKREDARQGARPGAAQARGDPGGADPQALEPEDEGQQSFPRRIGPRRSRCSATRGCSTGSPTTWPTCGLVGEDTNKLTAYLATVSRKLAKPLAVMVQSLVCCREVGADGRGARLCAGGGAGRSTRP